MLFSFFSVIVKAQHIKYTFASVLLCISGENKSDYNKFVSKGVSRINTDELKIIAKIIQNEIVHYADLAKVTGKSRKTLAKYLDHIASEVAAYNVQLVRKRNVGIYFQGDLHELMEMINISLNNRKEISKDERIIIILSQLLSESEEKPIQELCDELFVSRSTFENDLKKVKLLLEKDGAQLISNYRGIKINASERIKRRLMSDLLGMYWGDSGSLKFKHKNLVIPKDLPRDIQKLMDQTVLDKVSNVLERFEKESGFYLNDYEYQSLCIHLVIAIERIRNNEVLKSVDSDKMLEPETKKLAQLLEEEFAIKLPLDEDRYIDIHIMAAKDGVSTARSKEEREENVSENELHEFLTQNITSYDEVLIRNLTLHLIPALKRLSLGLKLSNPYSDEIKKYFPYSYNQAVDLGIKIFKEFNIKLNEDELAYITLHLQTYLERNNKKLTAVIVCSTGMGTARLIEQRIKNRFADQLKINRVTSVQSLKRVPITEDLVISTINISDLEGPVIVVPPFLDQHSLGKIQQKISQVNEQYQFGTEFMNLIDERAIIIDNQEISKNEAIEEIALLLEKTDYANPGIGKAAIEREELASTQINQVAVPHAPLSYVKHPCIGVYINKHGIRWGKGDVNLIFFLAMNKEVKQEINKIYEYFNEILEDQILLKQLISCKSNAEVIQKLGGENYE